MTRVFITGTAGFIGFHLAKLLLEEGFTVHGFDGMTDYYDVALKQRRHAQLLQNPNFAATEGRLWLAAPPLSPPIALLVPQKFCVTDSMESWSL